MTKEEFHKLQPGAIVRHKQGHQSWMVADVLGDGRFTLVMVLEATNPDEWDAVQPRTT